MTNKKVEMRNGKSADQSSFASNTADKAGMPVVQKCDCQGQKVP
jgi:hypothetical protein